MNRKELIQQIKEKQSFLCVGLDTDINKIPQCINHGLNIATEETLQIVSGVADAMICHASLREIVGTNFS